MDLYYMDDIWMLFISVRYTTYQCTLHYKSVYFTLQISV